MNRFIVLFSLSLMIVACKSKKEKKPEVLATNFFPVPTYVQGELKRLDTSLLSFIKIETANGMADSLPIKNSEVRKYAADFIALPDISAPDIKDDYEVSQLYDDIQGAFVFNFLTKQAHPLREENVTVEPEMNKAGKNDIRSIYAKLEQDSNDVSVTKILLWESGKGFYTTTITNAPGKEETVRKVQVIWKGQMGEK